MTVPIPIQAALVGGALSFAALFITMWNGFRGQKAEQERRRAQATIDYVQQAHKEWLGNERALQERLGSTRLCSVLLEEIDKDPESKRLMQSMLWLMETLAVGVFSGVYDKRLLCRFAGSFIANVYDEYYPYIAEQQHKMPSSYMEFEALAEAFRSAKQCRLSTTAPCRQSCPSAKCPLLTGGM